MAKDSLKPPIFDHLFADRVDVNTGNPLPNKSLVVTRKEVAQAILATSSTLGQDNIPNFAKDFLRSNSRNDMWPARIAALGWTMRQFYSDRRGGQVFEFLRFPLMGQVVPFPELFDPSTLTETHPVESISLPAKARALGRPDEPWLIQACVNLRVIETHFAVHSPLQVVDIFHLQNSVKGTPEIDALFLLTYTDDGLRQAVVTLEAKRDEPIIEDQIRAQIGKMGDTCTRNDAFKGVEFVIGLAAKPAIVNDERTVAVFEVAPIAKSFASDYHRRKKTWDLPLRPVAARAYRFVPPLPGI